MNKILCHEKQNSTCTFVAVRVGAGLSQALYAVRITAQSSKAQRAHLDWTLLSRLPMHFWGRPRPGLGEAWLMLR